jgi:hypothetical protein
MSEETYGAERARNLERMLRELALRIDDWDSRRELLSHAGELLKLLGDLRSELFHYEVRVTYDTPEVAEAQEQDGPFKPSDWKPDEDDEPTW